MAARTGVDALELWARPPGPPAPAAGTTTGGSFFLSVRGETLEEVGALWEGLRGGGVVVEPHGPARSAPAPGMLTDRFGITWILDAAAGRDP